MASTHTTNEEAKTGHLERPVCTHFPICLASRTGCMGEFRRQYEPAEKFSCVFCFRIVGHKRADRPAAGASPVVFAAGPALVRLRHDGGWLGRCSRPGQA